MCIVRQFAHYYSCILQLEVMLHNEMDVRKQPSTQCCSDTDEETVKEEKQLIAFVVEPFGFLEV